MPHIRPDCAEQSATNFSLQRRYKPNSLAVRLTRDVLLLRSAGSSRRAIAAALNLSLRRVQTILNGAAPGVQSERKAFTARERDADYANVEAALQAGSTLRAEHLKYATRCPAPYSYTSFWRRFEDWLEAQPDPGSASSGTPGGDTTSAATYIYPPRGPRASDSGSLGFPGLPWGSGGRGGRGRAVGSRRQVAAKLRLQPEIRCSPANTCDAPPTPVQDSPPSVLAIGVSASEVFEGPKRSSASEPLCDPLIIPGPKIDDSGEVLSGGSPLEGGLLFISEPDTALQIRKGALCVRYRDGVERTFPRGRHRVRSIMLASPGANVTIEAMRFAIDEGITIFVMHRAGEALAVLTDAPTVDASTHALELRRAQFAATPRQRLEVARAILAMKIEACELSERETQDALQSVANARDHAELLIAEAQTARVYWKRYVGFRPRLTAPRPGQSSAADWRSAAHSSSHVGRARLATPPSITAMPSPSAIAHGPLSGSALIRRSGFSIMPTRPAG